MSLLKILSTVNKSVYEFEGSLLPGLNAYPENELVLKKDGKVYNFNRVAWDTHRKGNKDLFFSVVNAIIRKDKTVEVLEMSNELKKYVDNFSETLEGYPGVPMWIVDTSCDDRFGLNLFTDKFIYYMNWPGDSCLMLDAKDNHLISDNSFALDGFIDTIEEIKRGNETLIYATDGAKAEIEGYELED